MKTITTLFIKIPEEMQETIAEEKMLEMEEDLQKISPKTLVEILQKGIFLFREELSGTEKVTCADYMEEGKYMKNFLLQNALATEAIRANISPIPILSIYTDEEVNLFASLYASAVSTELFFN